MKQYFLNKRAFFNKHHNDFKEHSDLTNNVIRKEYVFKDNAHWYEVSYKVVEHTKVTVHNVEAPVDVELFKLEYWNTDNPCSKFAYERW